MASGGSNNIFGGPGAPLWCSKKAFLLRILSFIFHYKYMILIESFDFSEILLPSVK